MNNEINKKEIAVLGGGCFWCMESVFSHTKGVESVVSGYTGGTKINPTYEEVCSGATGHAEVVYITFDPLIIKFEDLLNIFFLSHNPTDLNRQGRDIGSQYRTSIFYTSEEQKKTAEKVIKKLTEDRVYNKAIRTEITPFDKFYKAEEFHQKYFEKNPLKAYCQLIITPKLHKFRKKYTEHYAQ